MKSVAEVLEDRIRERAYHIWEASGRPFGRNEEFWQRACEQIAIDNGLANAKAERHQRAQPPRKRGRKRSSPLQN